MTRANLLRSLAALGLATVAGIGDVPDASAQIPVTRFPSNHASADQGGLRPAPKFGATRAPSTTVSSTQRDGWNLRWRRSDQVRTEPSTQPTVDVFAETPVAESPIAEVRVADVHAPAMQTQPSAALAGSVRQVSAKGNQRDDRMHIRQAAHAAVLMPQEDELLQMPSENGQSASPKNEIDFFEDPFGLPDPQATIPSPEDAAAPRLSPPPAEMATPAMPAESQSMDELRNQMREGQGNANDAPLELPTTPDVESQPVPQPVPEPAPPAPQPEQPSASPADEGPSLPDLMRQSEPGTPQTPPRNSLELLPPPADGSDAEPSSSDLELFDNPFDRTNGSDADRRDRDRLRQSMSDRTDGNILDEELRRFGANGAEEPVSGISCDEFRHRIARQTIRDVSLDISPPFRPDVIDEAEYQELKADFDEKQSTRQWRSIDGRPLASGRIVDLAYEKVVIENDEGYTEELPIHQLGEADLAFISENWGLPNECLIEQVAYTPRSWTQSTITWKASNLCHKPLYFEEVNLERYGHTAGPVLQPIVSSAHFFANIAVLPYKKGIHPPGECQYALGYYRPGNCAPWIVPPVPLSVRGAARQAAEMTALFWLIP